VSFVLDNSVAMRWLLPSTKAGDQKYANAVLASLTGTTALVPSLWHLEAANVMLGGRVNAVLEVGDMERFIAQLESLPIEVDALTAKQAFNRTLSLAQAYGISSYDASYLELAMREGVPLATLDKDLLKAARKANVVVYLK